MGTRVCTNEFLTAVSSKIQQRAVEIRDIESNDVFSDRFGHADHPIKYVDERPRFFYRNRV